MIKRLNNDRTDKVIFYTIIAYGIFSVGVVCFNILRNFDSVKLFYRPPDLFIFTYLLSILLGGFCVYRLILYYRETRSLLYLLLAVFIFGTSVSMFLWQFWLEYLSPVYDDITLAFTDFIEPEIMIGQANYYIGMIALLIFAIKLRPWKEYHIIFKILFIWMMYEIIWAGLLLFPFGRTLIWLDLITWEDLNNPQFIFNLFSPAYHLINQFPDPLSKIDRVYKLLDFTIPLFLAYIYFTAKPELNTKKIRNTKIFWIIFGFSLISLQLIRFLDAANLFQLNDGLIWYSFLSVKQTVVLTALTILLLLAPEALLITRAQIFQAKALYEKSVKGELGPTNPSQFHVFEYKKRFKDYFESLPLEIKNKLIE